MAFLHALRYWWGLSLACLLGASVGPAGCRRWVLLTQRTALLQTLILGVVTIASVFTRTSPHCIRPAGALEAAPAMGSADIILDLVSTGVTLRENNLKQIEVWCWGCSLHGPEGHSGPLSLLWPSAIRHLAGCPPARAPLLPPASLVRPSMMCCPLS